MTYDLRDILLGVQAEVTVILRELAQEIMLPTLNVTLSRAWMMTPDEAKEELLRQKPEMYARMMDVLNE